MREKRNLSVVFFGAVRNFPEVLPNIKRLLEMLERNFDVDLYLFISGDVIIKNVRSSENGTINMSGIDDLDWSVVEIVKKSPPTTKISQILAYGDAWHDGGVSIQNITKQYWTLKQYMMKAKIGDLQRRHVFLRVDLDYVDPNQLFKEICKSVHKDIYVPCWQGWEGGYNDRFAICNSQASVQAYCDRLDKMTEYVTATRESFHSERFLKWRLKSANLSVGYVKSKAVRVRVDGRRVMESNHGQIRIAVSELKKRVLKAFI